MSVPERGIFGSKYYVLEVHGHKVPGGKGSFVIHDQLRIFGLSAGQGDRDAEATLRGRGGRTEHGVAGALCGCRIVAAVVLWHGYPDMTPGGEAYDKALRLNVATPKDECRQKYSRNFM